MCLLTLIYPPVVSIFYKIINLSSRRCHFSCWLIGVIRRTELWENSIVSQNTKMNAANVQGAATYMLKEIRIVWLTFRTVSKPTLIWFLWCQSLTSWKLCACMSQVCVHQVDAGQAMPKTYFPWISETDIKVKYFKKEARCCPPASLT